ncbi:hypothetical protein CDAR_409781 [Caerostris darwini]|uniref:Uncharacterized protein n=1 Tax=Caerostris darwini TaxID=1538125 RepID=A0AAV4RM26_9ARAC|nr:hypothetical protein CDAR_409781 [Caerostris darwini]
MFPGATLRKLMEFSAARSRLFFHLQTEEEDTKNFKPELHVAGALKTGDITIYSVAPRVTNDSKLYTSVGILPSPEDIQEIFLSEVRWRASKFETSYWEASLGETAPFPV